MALSVWAGLVGGSVALSGAALADQAPAAERGAAQVRQQGDRDAVRDAVLWLSPAVLGLLVGSGGLVRSRRLAGRGPTASGAAAHAPAVGPRA